MMAYRLIFVLAGVLLILVSKAATPRAAQAQSVPAAIFEGPAGSVPYEQFHKPLAIPLAVSDDLPASVPGWQASDIPTTVRPEFAGHHTEEPTVGFEDLTGWTAEFSGGVSGEFFQSQRQRLQGEWVAHLRYRAPAQGAGEIRLIPPEPIPVPDDADHVGIWVYATEWWGWEPQTVPPSSLVLVFDDGAGRERRLTMEQFNWKEWFWVDRLIPETWTRPLKLVAIAVTNVRGGGSYRELFLDALRFYQDAESRRYPERVNAVPAWYPDSPTATVPPASAAPVIEADAEGFWVHTHGAEEISYRVVPKTGTLSDVEVWVGGVKRFIPFSGGGIVAQLGNRQVHARTSGVQRTCHVVEVTDSRAVMHCAWTWQNASYEFDLRFLPAGKSLVIEVEGPVGGRGVSLGRVLSIDADPSPTSAPDRLIEVPFWTLATDAYREGNPKVLSSGGLFVTAYMDWYASNASRLYAVRGTEVSPEGAAVNGGSQYLPLTDGSYRPVFERIVLNVSSRFDEVLPAIPHAPSPHKERLKNQVHASYFTADLGSRSWPNALLQLRSLRALGVAGLFVRTHEEAWRDGGESFTMRVNAAPGKGGDEALAEYVRAARSELGYDFALYTNYTDYAPVNANFTEQWVARASSGEMLRAWPRNYLVNSTVARAFESVIAPTLAERYGVNGSYTDVHTARAPWDNVDYDHRAPGAGMFKTVYQDYGSLLLHDRASYQGIVMSEGRLHWLYAGLVDANYGLLWMEDIGSWETLFSGAPLLLDFQLKRIHPLQGDTNVAYWTPAPTDPFYYQQLAMIIAFGNRAHLSLPGQPELLAQTYHLMHRLQQRYVMEPVARIGYATGEPIIWNERNLLSTEEAVALGAYTANRAYVEYENGLRLWVNAAKPGSEPWSVAESLPAFLVSGEHGGSLSQDSGSHPGTGNAFNRSSGEREWTLPPGGWLAVDDGLLALSALVNGRRLDLVITPDYLYVNPGSRPLSRDDWNALGITALQPVEADVPLVILPKQELPAGSLLTGPSGTPASDLEGAAEYSHVLIVLDSSSRWGKVRFVTQTGIRDDGQDGAEAGVVELFVRGLTRTAVNFPQ